MIAVTDHAAPHIHGCEGRFVRALVVEVLHQHVAGTADIRHAPHARRCGAVIAMAGSATRRREVPALLEGLPMHALPVLRELVGRNLVLGHVLRIGMAARAGSGQAQRMDGRKRVFDLPDTVYAVTIDADRGRCVAGRDALPVSAGQVLRILVHAFLRFVLVHERRVAVAARAKLRHRQAGRLADEASRPAHGRARVVRVPVSPMAVGAAKAETAVYIVREGRRGCFESVLQHAVALHAGVLRGARRHSGDRQKRPAPECSLHRQYPSAEKVAR